MSNRLKSLPILLLVAALLPAAPALAKKNQGARPTDGPPGFSAPQNDRAQPNGSPSLGATPANTPRTADGMPPGQRKKSSAPARNKQKNGPPAHAPAWGYRNGQR